LPPEIVTERKIRAKKPWAAAAAAAMLVGVALSGIGYARVEQSVSTERFGAAEQAVAGLKSEVDGYAGEYTQAETRHEEIMTKGQVLLDNLERRAQWLELYKAINEALPRDPGGANEADPSKQERIHLQSITAQHVDDVSLWFKQLAAAKNYAISSMSEVDQKPPVGPGYIIKLSGYHFHEDGHPFENNTLLKNLQQWRSENKVPIRELGITHAAIVQSTDVREERAWHPDPRVQALIRQAQGPGGFEGGGPGGGPGIGPGIGPGAPGGGIEGGEAGGLDPEVAAEIKYLKERRFVLHFVWQPTLRAEREVNELFYQLLTKNKDAAFTDAQAAITQWNEQHLDRKPIEITEEQFTKFKHKYFEKPTADAAAAAASGVPGGSVDGMAPGMTPDMGGAHAGP
jgi:type IV pilus assembly protein PilM